MLEIERKFLVTTESLDTLLANKRVKLAYHISQGYIVLEENIAIRVRIEKYPSKHRGFDNYRSVLAIKRPTDSLLVRREDQYEIPQSTARNMLDGFIILEKSRYAFEGYDIDVFEKELTGLIVAEKEYNSIEEAEADVMPEWAYKEVTYDPAYINSNLIRSKFVDGELK